jgi:hypothetical protein
MSTPDRNDDPSKTNMKRPLYGSILASITDIEKRLAGIEGKKASMQFRWTMLINALSFLVFWGVSTALYRWYILHGIRFGVDKYENEELLKLKPCTENFSNMREKCMEAQMWIQTHSNIVSYFAHTFPWFAAQSLGKFAWWGLGKGVEWSSGYLSWIVSFLMAEFILHVARNSCLYHILMEIIRLIVSPIKKQSFHKYGM